MVSLSLRERTEHLRRANQVKITVIPPDGKGKPRMSFSELYQKAIEETERKGDRLTDGSPGSPSLPLLRMSSLQETRSAAPHGDQCLTARSSSLEKAAARSQRIQEDSGLDPRPTPPDVVLAANPQHLPPCGRAEAGDAQVPSLRVCSSSSGTGSPEVYSGPEGGSDPGLPEPRQVPPSCPLTEANPSLPACAGPHDLIVPVDSPTEWQTLADISSYCDSLAQSLTMEDEDTVEDAWVEENVGLTGVNSQSKSPARLTEKVDQLERLSNS
ncbi:signal-induced proliferation-associated protein 1-like [Scyliorhinus canicula]|uniref:signal-induced proliferation-associated protein 1-like n=1 Tax=Scyliorhinus canicula TaxID=7830 RepID=UPI0018F64E9B|nr:signal-induced proliferation-associated protein 1-like [Scyliorhinus canicula]